MNFDVFIDLAIVNNEELFINNIRYQNTIVKSVNEPFDCVTTLLVL